MSFKKVTDSQTDGMYIIGSSDKSRYPVGFQYMVGRTMYTVREDVTKDSGSGMRRVVTSEGAVEIMTLEPIDLDLKEPDAQVLDDGKPKVEEPVPPVQPEPIDMREAELPKDTTEKEKEKSDEFEGLDW